MRRLPKGVRATVLSLAGLAGLGSPAWANGHGRPVETVYVAPSETVYVLPSSSVISTSYYLPTVTTYRYTPVPTVYETLVPTSYSVPVRRYVPTTRAYVLGPTAYYDADVVTTSWGWPVATGYTTAWPVETSWESSACPPSRVIAPRLESTPPSGSSSGVSNGATGTPGSIDSSVNPKTQGGTQERSSAPPPPRSPESSTTPLPAPAGPAPAESTLDLDPPGSTTTTAPAPDPTTPPAPSAPAPTPSPAITPTPGTSGTEGDLTSRESQKPIYSQARSRSLLRGRVINSSTLRPESQVQVVLTDSLGRYESRVVVTDAQGRYQASLPDGDWKVQIKKTDGKMLDYGRVTAGGGVISEDDGQDIPSLTLKKS